MKSTIQCCFIFMVIIIIIMDVANMATITLDLHEQQCFHEHIERGKNTQSNVSIAKLSIIFDVIAGGFTDINFYLKNTRIDTSLYKSLGTSSDRLMIAINEPGTYEYCFDNNGATVSHSTKMIRFEVVISFNHSLLRNNTNNDDYDDIDKKRMLNGLNQQLLMVKYEAEIQRYSMIVHHELNEQTNHMLMMWSAFETAIIVMIFIGEVYYLKHFFETKRYL